MPYDENVREVVETLRKIKIVPVLVLDNVEDGLKMCDILVDNGLNAAEITFRTPAAEKIIREADADFPELIIGAGTVLNVEDLHRAFDAGAKFAVAPGFNPTVVKEAVDNGFAFMPGVSGPSEIEQAMELSVRHFKFFPAEAVGGVAMLKSIIAPYRHLGISFMPTGGLNPGNVNDYLEIPEVTACGGTWLGKSADIAEGNWEKIETLVREAVAMLS